MPIELPEGEIVTLPHTGKRLYFLDSDGLLKEIKSDGTRSQVIGGAASIATSAAPLTLSGLTPATAGDYDIFGVFNINQANSALKLQFNGSDSNAFSVTGNLFNGAVRHAAWGLGRTGQDPLLLPNASVLVLTGRLYAKVGRPRCGDFNWYLFTSGGAADDAGNWRCYLNDTSTALTSLVMVATAGGFDSASFLRATSVPNSS